MLKVGLDMAMNSCGVALYTNKKLRYDSFTIKKNEAVNLTVIERADKMIRWLDAVIGDKYKIRHELIIEDIFHGKNIKSFKDVSKIQGAFGHHYYMLTGKLPTFKMAVSARKDLDIRTRASKAEVQIYVIDRFSLCKIDKEIRSDVNTNLKLYQAKKLSASTFKSRMNTLSTKIKKSTGIDEHMADAIILTM